MTEYTFPLYYYEAGGVVFPTSAENCAIPFRWFNFSIGVFSKRVNEWVDVQVGGYSQYLLYNL